MPDNGPVARLQSTAGLTVDERRARGRDARRCVPRRTHATWAPAADRPDPVSVIEAGSASRVPELVPVRYGRMSASAFTFYRGCADLMAMDLAAAPRSGLIVQLSGDAHLSNFGFYAAPDRSLVFDLNDFDETLPGPWEFDIKRLVTSFEVLGRERGFSATERRSITMTAAAEYRCAMASFAETDNMSVYYARLDAETILQSVKGTISPARYKRAQAEGAKMLGRTSSRAAGKLTVVVDGQRRFDSRPPLPVPIRELVPDVEADRIFEFVQKALCDYRRSLPDDRKHLLDGYAYTDAARKVVGVGSVGERANIVLLTGRDDGDPLVLQLKEAQSSVLEPYFGRSRYTLRGRRVVEGQRLMQAASDVFLGWVRMKGVDGVLRDHYVRQLADGKGSIGTDEMRPAGAQAYARICGWTLARAHARSGDRVAIASYLGRSTAFDEALAAFAATYADQNERDYEAFMSAIASGRLEATTGI